jgi:hypothetical protein
MMEKEEMLMLRKFFAKTTRESSFMVIKKHRL